jgi:hypothetical protein
MKLRSEMSCFILLVLAVLEATRTQSVLEREASVSWTTECIDETGEAKTN